MNFLLRNLFPFLFASALPEMTDIKPLRFGRYQFFGESNGAHRRKKNQPNADFDQH